MNNERAQEIEFLRSEMMGPSRPVGEDYPGLKVEFNSSSTCQLPAPGELKGSVFWQPEGQDHLQEVIRRETPAQRYGIGLLYPGNYLPPSDEKPWDSERPDDGNNSVVGNTAPDAGAYALKNEDAESDTYSRDEAAPVNSADDEDFEVNGSDAYKPSTMGVSFCIDESCEGEILIRIPIEKRLFWQQPDSEPFLVNGVYERCTTVTTASDGTADERDAWRRRPALRTEQIFTFDVPDLLTRRLTKQEINLSNGIKLQLDLYSRSSYGKRIVTVVLRNSQVATNLSYRQVIEQTLYQACFEVEARNGASFTEYPQGRGEHRNLDDDEKTLSLLYRNSANWAIGHGCAATWRADEGQTPMMITADCMPAVELPSMTPDIIINGSELKLSMRDLANIQNTDSSDPGWASLETLVYAYEQWINDERKKASGFNDQHRETAERHLNGCNRCLARMKSGLDTLAKNTTTLNAFRLANKAMWFQQTATKDIQQRPLKASKGSAEPVAQTPGSPMNPDEAWQDSTKSTEKYWRAFQAAFLLLSIESFTDPFSDDREITDLIWFPTGGGKTEAYLGVAAFYMFLQRLEPPRNGELRKDGTNVFMRYTLRMLTTQQFQRAASLICSMEYIRARSVDTDLGTNPFTLGLWVGRDASPNRWKDATSAIRKFKNGETNGNPLVITECPWCRSEIGLLKGKTKKDNILSGIIEGKQPYLKCSDMNCHFGTIDTRLPIEVIDEALYKNPPSMFISTADKFAILAFKPQAGALFGIRHYPETNGPLERVAEPPGLIIQDEFHLISGPLGSIYGLYETVIERLCTQEIKGNPVRPKVIASTATIRGAVNQTKAIYSRSEDQLQLFPNPGLDISDSFFGRYAREANRELKQGRLYLGINATGYKSFLTTQVRAFSAALFRSSLMPDDSKDAWWSLLAFYNSLRELGGASTLFSSDISARMKDFMHRYNVEDNHKRYLNKTEELTSRRTQAELVKLMDELSRSLTDTYKPVDACLASNIIEVGVDIDRLSLMAIVGQPKSTAQYIQVSGRVGRRWWERPGLIMMMYNPNKSRDLSHFEHFQNYHQRLYEQVEPTSTTPFSIETVKRAAAGIMLLWARQQYHSDHPGATFGNYESAIEDAKDFLVERCELLFEQQEEEADRVVKVIEQVHGELLRKGRMNPLMWHEFPQKPDGSYLMLWPGAHSSSAQQKAGVNVLSSMRNVDGTARLSINERYMELEGDQNGQ